MTQCQNYEFYCPHCGKKADTANPMFIRYSLRRLELRIFLCSPCRTIYIDKPTIRRIISEWRKDCTFTRKMPFEKLYREFLDELEEMLRSHFIARLGYKQTHFIKYPKQNP